MTNRITYDGKVYRRVGDDIQRAQHREGNTDYWMTLTHGRFRDFIIAEMDAAKDTDDIWKGIRASPEPTNKYKRKK